MTTEDTTATTKPKKNDRKRDRSRRERTPSEPKEFQESILCIQRVTRVTAGGRQMRFKVTVAIGNNKGKLGFGMGKSSEVVTGVHKAIAQAKQRLITIPLAKHTIAHPVSAKFKATKIMLLPAPDGKGIIAGGAVRKIMELSGVQNVLSKIHGSRNKINSAYATIKALQDLRPPLFQSKKNKTEDSTNDQEDTQNKTTNDPKTNTTKSVKPTTKNIDDKKTVNKKVPTKKPVTKKTTKPTSKKSSPKK